MIKITTQLRFVFFPLASVSDLVSFGFLDAGLSVKGMAHFPRFLRCPSALFGMKTRESVP